MYEASRTIVERATDDFLRHLRERNASAHTIKAYTGDLDVFAAYIGSKTRLEQQSTTSRFAASFRISTTKG
jgi:site-specific recombinase XerD